MSKLDKHADLIKKLYAERGTAKGTHIKLLEQGVKVSYETVRHWLNSHKSELPALRRGAGRPKSEKVSKPYHLFKLLTNSVSEWMPDAGVHPEWFLIFSPDNGVEVLNAYLVTALQQYGVQTSLNDLETTELPLTQMRGLCDLELYVLGYLLGCHAPLIGATRLELIELTRVLTPMVIELKEVIMRRNSIKMEELRKLLIAAEANCRNEIASRTK